MVNPEIVSVSDETQTGLEGCLSLPGKWGIVTRPLRATVRAQDRYGEWYEYEGEELLARAFLHEIDHLDGHLYPEIAEKMLTAEELEELLKQEEDAIEAETETFLDKIGGLGLLMSAMVEKNALTENDIAELSAILEKAGGKL